MNIYMIKDIPNQIKPLSFLKDSSEVVWWTRPNKNQIALIHTETEDLMLREDIALYITYFNKLPNEVQGFFALYNYDISELKRNLGKERWLRFLALHFKKQAL